LIRWLLSPFAVGALFLNVAAALLARRRFGKLIPILILLLGVGGLVSTYYLAAIPLPEQVALPQAAEVYDRHGRLIGTYSDVRRFIIDTRHLPPYVARAVVAAEDRDFYSHGGVSLRGVVRATWANVTSGSIQQGGSTITQQYVKNALLHDRSRTISRKVKEAVLAIKLEDHYSKEQILDFYLNTIYFGRGAYGIEAAARTYFDENAEELSLPQAALLAGLIRAPATLQPDAHPARAWAARDRVLRAMADEGYITEARRMQAAAARVVSVAGVEERAGLLPAAYFMEWLRRDILYPRFKECLYTCGLKIYTTLDLDMQRYAEQAVASVLDRRADPQAALVAMTPSGEVRALVGGRGFQDATAASGFNFATDLPGRHAGSAFKPFTLLAGVEAGMSPGDVYSGVSPLSVTDRPCATPQQPWKVANYEGNSYGSITLASATAASVNTVFAQLASDVGPRALARLVGRFGFDRAGSDGTREIPPYCSLALGALAVTPLEMARAYAGLAADGLLPAVVPVRYVTDSFNHCLVAFVAPGSSGCDDAVIATPSRAVRATSAAAVGEVLAGVVAEGTGTGADIGRAAAGKTGTSQNNTDAWFTGYVPQLAAAVWMGYPAEVGGKLVPEMRSCDDRKRCRPVHGAVVTGGSLPARIWALFMRKATAGFPRDRSVSPGAPTAPAKPPPAPSVPPATAPKKEPAPKPPQAPSPAPPPPEPDPLPIPLPTISP
jgi:penicillin-binding protein 1A